MMVVVHTARRTTGVAALTLLAAYIGAELVRQPLQIRFIAAVCLGLLAVVGATQWPRTALVATLVCLPYLAFSKRILLEFAPWKSTDPLLLVAPAVLTIVLIHVFVIEGRPLGGDRLSQLMLVVLGLTLIQVFNPRGGGLTAGTAALLFTAVPMLWFFAGRELVSRRAMGVLFGCLVVSACLISVYGLYQTWHGLPAWDAMWVAQSGYAALVIGSTIRAIGTFSSAAEYASFTGIAIVAALAFALDRRPYFLPAVPLLSVALFYESSRGIIVTTVIAALVVLAAKTGSMRRATLTLVVLLAGTVVGIVLTRGAVRSAAASSSNSLVRHQLGGLAHPLNQKDSTLTIHLNELGYGFKKGLLDPIGNGISSTTLAGSRLGSAASQTSEVDVSNEFIALGTFGGIAYIGIVVLGLIAALHQAVARRDAVSLTILGMLVALFGQWLNGGFYAVAPLIWVSIGFLVAAERERSATRAS